MSVGYHLFGSIQNTALPSWIGAVYLIRTAYEKKSYLVTPQSEQYELGELLFLLWTASDFYVNYTNSSELKEEEEKNVVNRQI